MHPNEALARREMELLLAGRLDQLAQVYADDLVFHFPGRNPIAGSYSSFEEFDAKFEKLFGEDGKLERVLHDALGTDDHAVQLIEVSAEAKGKTHSWRGAAIMHITDGKISELWIHVDDQYALDDFLNSLA